jgi:hypothetical protein
MAEKLPSDIDLDQGFRFRERLNLIRKIGRMREMTQHIAGALAMTILIVTSEARYYALCLTNPGA